MCECLVEEIEDLRAEVKQEAERANSWRRLWLIKRNTVGELRAALSNTEAELSDVRSDLVDTTKTLDKHREMRDKLSKANLTLTEERDLALTANLTLTEERDLARELFQGVLNEYDDLLGRYGKSCDDYEKLASRFIWRNDAD